VRCLHRGVSEVSKAVSETKLRRKARRKRQEKLKSQGQAKPRKATLPNRNSVWKTPEEEVAGRQQAVEETLNVFRQLLPGLLHDLAKIEDPRNPKKTKHKLTVLLLYGMLAFVFQYASRREAGREMSRPVLCENLKALFPELESLPHQDTLCRLLERIEVKEIEEAHLQLLRRLIRSKKFQNYLVKKRYLIAVDGTQKFVTETCLSEEQLNRKPGGKEEPQYYVYLLEAKLVFSNGLVLPLMSEFLDNTVDEVSSKQDCELKAFYRLVARLKAAFPRLPVTLLLDGLYANGPVMALCRRNRWEFMIVLQNESLPSVWKEANALMKLHPEQTVTRTCKGRHQTFRFTNDIEYVYGSNARSKQTVHVVVCEETWEEVDDHARIVMKASRHAWLSSEPLHERNLHVRCNEMARSRWGLENDILQEKRQGYQYEHVFAYDWNAMRGYHYLMHLAHLMNELAGLVEVVAALTSEFGIRGFLRLLRETIAGPWLDHERIRELQKKRSQLRFAS
jgi:hypothetical protein